MGVPGGADGGELPARDARGHPAVKQAAARKHPELFQDPRSGSVIYRCPFPRVAAGGKRLAEIEAELAELGRESVLAQLTRRGEHRGAMGSPQHRPRREVILPILADPSIPDEQVGGTLRSKIGRQVLRDTQATCWTPLPPDQGHLAALAASYAYLR